MDFDKILLSLKAAGILILSIPVFLLSFIIHPVIGLIYPPLEEFRPAPEPPSATIEKTVSIEGWSILYDAQDIPAVKTAAETLAATLSRITGLQYAASTAMPAGMNEILVGTIAGLDVSELGMDGYIIKEDGGNIRIAGGEPRGTLYGVYRFLYKYFDCRWFSDDLIVIPEGPAALAPIDEERFVPIFDHREQDWLGSPDHTFSVAHGLNGTRIRSLPAQMGGNYGYNGHSGHTMVVQFVHANKFFADHPEWYAWREDQKKHVPSQLCLTNPEVLAQMIVEVRYQLDHGNGQRIVPVTHHDNLDYCQCGPCKAIDEAEGSHMGTMLHFVNAVADAIAESHPWAFIDTFAYQYTRTPTKHVRPRDNVIIRLCSIECCFAHTLDDPDCPENAAFARDIKFWSGVSKQLYIWDYTTNFMHFNCLYPNLQVLQKNMQFFAENKVKGVYEEGNYNREGDSEFQRLRSYLLSRLLFDPYIDYYAEMDEFLKAYYGGGWQYIREFIDLVSEDAGKKDWLGRSRHLWFWMSPKEGRMLDLRPNQIAYADRLWEKAIELAGDETYRRNVLNSSIGWRYLKACNRKSEYSWLNPPGEWTAENERLYNDIKDLGITTRGEWVKFTANPSWYDTPIDWRD